MKSVTTHHLLLVLALSLTLMVSCKGKRQVSTRAAHYPKGKVSNRTASRAISTAKSYMGTPYKYGGTSRRGLDCSGLVMLSFRKAGLNLPRTSRSQAKVGQSVSRKRLEPGDLVFFSYRKDRRVSHVGIVTEVRKRGKSVKFIHASTKLGVCESDLYNPHYQKVYVKARRIVD